jgi:hypothetical protein
VSHVFIPKAEDLSAISVDIVSARRHMVEDTACCEVMQTLQYVCVNIVTVNGHPQTSYRHRIFIA